MKDIIGEAAESMREPWELYIAEQNKLRAWPLNSTRLDALAIGFVARLMPDEQPGMVLAVAKRLKEG